MNSLFSTGLQSLDRVTYKLEKNHHIYVVCKKHRHSFCFPLKISSYTQIWNFMTRLNYQ